MNTDFRNRALTFAARHAVELGEELGTGTQGAVFALIDKLKSGPAAVKFHYRAHSYTRECAAYRKLTEVGVESVLGFNVPKLLRTDDDLLAIEMTVVRRPYVLDFAGAWIDEEPPEFSDEVWDEWRREKIEQFGPRWPTVQRLLSEFRPLGVHLLDVSPGNIAFGP